MKGLIILANGFEDVEAIATIDVLRRSKLTVDMVTVNNTLDVLTQSNILLKAEKMLKDVNKKEYDFLIIPGGKAVRLVLNNHEELAKWITDFVDNKKLVAAICAAPSLVGKLGYFDNIPFTCFPGFHSTSTGGIYHQEKGVIRVDNFITAKSMGYSIEFALEIIDYLQGAEQRNDTYKNIFGEL